MKKQTRIVVRNRLARAVRDPQGSFAPKSERDRTKYRRKIKHPKQEAFQ